MADNVIANAGSGGATFVTAAFSWSGDTAHATGCFQGIISGSEGAWTFTPLVGGVGVVGAGVQRVTLASDDPAVAKLTTIDVDTGAIVTSAASIDGKITACNTGAVVIASGAITATLAAETTKVIGTINIAAAQTITVTNAGTFSVQAAQSGTWTVQPGNTANTTAWLVTGTGGTFPITATALPLPSGAATSTLQGGGLPAALGAGGGLKVDGSGTALPVSGTVSVTGTFWQATQPVSLASVPSHEVTNAGTFAVQVSSIAAGTNAIGKLAANSGVDIGDVDVTSIAAGTNTIGGVIAQHGNVAYDSTTACTIKNAMVVTSTDGATLIAAVASKKFRILAMSVLSASTTVTNFWLEDADGADVYGDSTGLPVQTTGASGPAGVVLNFNPGGWFTTATVNKNLVIKLTAAQKVVVTLTYIEVA